MPLRLLPPLPVDRGGSETVSETQSGSQFWSSSGDSSASGDGLQLAMEGNSWGIWCLPFSGDDLLSVDVLAIVEAGSIYIGIADFQSGRWIVEGPLPAGKKYELSTTRNLSPADNCYVMVMAPTGSSAVVKRLILETERPRWQVVTIAENAGADSYRSSLEVVAGHPAIAFGDVNDGHLRYVRAGTATGSEATDWTNVLTIDATLDTGKWCSLAVVNGGPAISYQQSDEGRLFYIFSVTEGGDELEDWSEPVIVDSHLQVGGWSSLSEVEGNPAICYYDFNNQRLKYARSTTADGAQSIFWSQKVIIDDTPSAGTACRLEVVDGHPAIAYHVLMEGVLRYVRSSSKEGSQPEDWSGIITVDDTPVTGTYISLAIVDGNPAISCYSQADDGLKYFRSSTASGGQTADWADPVVFPMAGLHTSLSVIGGQPAMCFNNPLTGNLRYVRAGSSTGSAISDWGEVETVEEAGDTGHRCSMKMVDGKPAMTYVDAGTGEVKYAIRL